MTVDQVFAMVEAESSERGVAHWNTRFPDSSLRSLGVGLTRLRKLARKIGRDHALALQLWGSEIYELRVLGLLIDEPRHIRREQAEEQVEHLQEGQLAHVFSSCDASLARVPYVQELAEDWVRSEDPMRQRCGYGLIYELSKARKKSAPSDADFEAWIKRISTEWEQAEIDVRMAMSTALMGMGKRSARLYPQALRLAREIGPIDWDATGSCEPFDVVKHLDKASLRQKLGM